MYKGNNPTAIQSQRWFVEGMISLMAEKPYSKITVQDLCQRSDLSRQTFYNFFSDKEEVLRFCIEQSYREQFQRIADRDIIGLPDILEAFFTVVADTRCLLNAILRDGLDWILADEMQRCVSLFTDLFIPNSNDPNIFLPYSKVMLAGGLSQMLILWIRQGEELTVQQMAELITAFMDGGLFDPTGLTINTSSQR